MYALVRGPAEEEEASSEDNRANHHWRNSGFWNSLVAVRVKSTIIIALIQSVCSSTDKDTDQQSQERQSTKKQAPSTFFLDFDGERGKIGVQDIVDERSI